MRLLLLISLRNVFRQKVRSSLTAISLIFGYLLLSLAIGATEGSYDHIINNFTKTQTGHIQVHAKTYREKPALYKLIQPASDFKSQLVGTAYTSRVLGPGLAYANGKSGTAFVRGVEVINEDKLTGLAKRVKQGSYFKSNPDAEGRYSVMLGASIAKILRIKIGQELVIISQGADGSIANDAYSVSAIVGDKNSPERQMIYMPLAAAQDFFSTYGMVHEWALLTDNYKLSRLTAKELSLKIPEYEIAPWQVVEKEFYRAMLQDKNGNNITLAIIVFVIAIGVLNTILMATLERTREYGVQMALGTRPLFLFFSIMLESLFLSSMSLMVGMVLSLPMNYWMEHTGFDMGVKIDMAGMEFSHMYGEISYYSTVTPALYMLFAALLFSLYPAIRAAKLSPIIAMRST